MPRPPLSTRAKELTELIQKVDLSDIIPRDPVNRRIPRNHWAKRSNRVRAIRALVERSGVPVYKLRIDHFDLKGLMGIFYHYPPPRLPAAIKDAGYDFTGGQIDEETSPYRNPDERRKLAQGLAKKLNKEVCELTGAEIRNASLGPIIFWAGGLGKLIRECGYDPNMTKRSRGFWTIRANRKKVVEDVLKVTGKHPTELTAQDVIAHGAGTLFVIYQRFPQEQRLNMILSDVGLSDEPLAPDEWGLPPRGIPGRWENISKKERVRILLRIAEKLGIDIEVLTRKAIERLGLSGLALEGRDAPGTFDKLFLWAGLVPGPVRRWIKNRK